MTKRRAFFFVALLLLATALRAQQFPRVDEAAKPLGDGVPHVAIIRLESLLAQELPQEERGAAANKLAEALIAAREPLKALRVLDGAAQQPSTQITFLRAQALAALARWDEALPLYQQSAADTASPLRGDAMMGEAEALRAKGRREDALRVLTQLRAIPEWNVRAGLRAAALWLDRKDPLTAGRLLDTVQARSAADRKEKRLLRGRTEAALGHTDKAIELFTSILKKAQGATHEVLLGALFSIADLHLQSHTPESGDDFVEDYIEHYPLDSELPRVFAKLDQLYRAERKPARRDLGRWASEPTQPRRALAQWYLALMELRAGRRDEALRNFANLRETHPALPALAEAYLQFAQIAVDERRFDDATALLAEARTLNPAAALLERINLLDGQAQYRAGKWQTAAQTFETVGRARSQLALDGLYNASLAWLEARDSARFLVDAREVAAAGADDNVRGDLQLEQALVQAAQNDASANDSLQKFLHDFPHHPRASEAWVALAEVAFHASSPRLRDAQKFLERATQSEPTPAAIERADYLRIWIADAAPDPNAPGVIALGNEFLQKHNGSAFAPDVRMKLAEAYFRRQDFAGAQTQFELLAQQDPNGRYTEKAQFFAAESALQSMGAQGLDRALALLNEVVRRGGEMKWAARNEQAVVERKFAKPQEALTLYDEVLKGDAKPSEKREALCGKADVLYELAAGDREKYAAAMELYQQLAGDREASPHWRNQALFKAGMCLEKMADRPHALETFYRVIDNESRPDKPREFFWFYKAGFNAARLLEEQSEWAPAASVYQKLALAGGDRSEEAKSRLGRLRLEHFLWDQ